MDLSIGSDALSKFIEIWNYTLLTVDKNKITIGTVVVGLTILTLGTQASRWLSKKLVRRLLKKTTKMEIGSLAVIESLSFYIILLFFILFAMRMMNIPLTIFTVFGGALAIGVGFGSQNLVNNFISGLILMIERPVKVGDFVEVDGVFGRVENIGSRSTQVHAIGNRHIIVPNSSFLEKNVLNWTHYDFLVTTSVKVGVAYGSDTKKVKELLLEACESQDEIIKSRDIMVYFRDFGDNSLNFEVYFWHYIREIRDKSVIESNVRFKIDELFREANITIAFPQRDIHLFQEKPLEVSLQK